MCIRDSTSVRPPSFPPRWKPPGKRPCATPTTSVSYTHLRAHETPEHLVCRLLLIMIRRPPRSTRVRSSAASDVYKRQHIGTPPELPPPVEAAWQEAMRNPDY